jgi:hypothetical protein
MQLCGVIVCTCVCVCVCMKGSGSFSRDLADWRHVASHMTPHRRATARQTSRPVQVVLGTPDGDLLEGLSSNFFALHRGVVVTADEGVLSGTIREIVLEVGPRVWCARGAEGCGVGGGGRGWTRGPRAENGCVHTAAC